VRPAVASVTYAPVKGTRLRRPPSVVVDEHGVPGDRAFHLLEAETGRQLSALPGLLTLGSDWDPVAGRLTVELPEHGPVVGTVRLGGELTAIVSWDGNRPVATREVIGPWAALVSEHLGREVVLARPGAPRRAVDVGPLTLASLASVRRVSQHLGGADVDPARFRMNIYVDGVEAHAEDGWYGRRVAVGEAVLRVTGPVPRCAIVTSDPVTGVRDLPVLKAIVGYRDPIPDPGTGTPVKAPFGVYADVVVPGRIAAGDRVEVLDR